MEPTRLLFCDLGTAPVPYHFQDIVITSRYRSYPHTHDFHEFFLVTAGTVLHTINGSRHDVPHDMLVRIRPEDAHFLRPAGAEEPRLMNFACTVDELKRAERYLGIREGAPYTGSTRLDSRTAAALRHTASGMKNPGITAEALTMACRQLLVALLSAGHGSGPDSGTALPAWLGTTCRAMDAPEHYRKGVREFVRLAGCTQEHLTRSLRKHLGTTPTEFINGRKIREAAVLLQTTGRQVVEIAYEAGFNNLSHFTGVFKRTYGTTPTGYRRMRGRIINA